MRMTLPAAQTLRRLLPSFSLEDHSEEGFLWLTDLTVGTDHYLNLRPQVKHNMKGHIL